jgi:hypothetical protein
MLTTLSFRKRTIKMQSFEKVIESLKDKATPVRIKIETPSVNEDDFLKVLWSGDAGILLQNEVTKKFIAVENMYSIHSFELNGSILAFTPFKKYYLK